MIEISEVGKHFGKFNVLNNVTLNFDSGKCVALIGPNGCGKTTLIKSILGMVLPDKGSIRFNKKDIHKDYLYRNKIGYMPQIGRYPENMNVGQVIDALKTLRNSEMELDHQLHDSYKIQDILGKRMANLSGGTRQKVSAVIAFMFNPDVLILDEPTAGLDPLSAEILKEKISYELEKKKLVIITSHLLSELDGLADEIIFMQDGTVKFHKNIEILKSETNTNTLAKAIAGILKMESA